jgi:hypothetical protein
MTGLSSFQPNTHFARLFQAVLSGFVLSVIVSKAACALDASSISEHIDLEWGGHVKIQGRLSDVDDRSIFKYVETGYFADGACDFRLMNKAFLGNRAILEIHYEAVLSGGDTRRRTNTLTETYPVLEKWISFIGTPVDDKRRLLDLTKTISEDDGDIFYHRLDRLLLTFQPDWGALYLGRQALTWGNGMLFNPMDLFNPFPPTDVEKDYKVGDDMARGLFFIENLGEFQILYVPRRDLIDGDVSWDESSFAGKLHRAFGSLEFDLMAATHYSDYVFGLGSTGYVKGAAWRLDVTWTVLDDHLDKNGFLSLDANLDYSWTWMAKNMYAFVELFYNGLGQDDYVKAITDPAVLKRLARGELFTLGKTYLSGMIQLETHPLVNIFLTLINNLKDPSGIIQPKMVWDIKQYIQLNTGGTFYYGGSDTEYGKFYIEPYDFYQVPADSIYCILTCFF